MQNEIMEATEKFQKLLKKQLERAEQLRGNSDVVNYKKLDKIIIGICGGDGIGPIISKQAKRVLEYVLREEIATKRIEIREIPGLTIENRVKCQQAIPSDVLNELKECDVILKGPTTTPRSGDEWTNVESANVAMRKELDLFANVRPVKIPSEDIDWTFFRENTEGGYAVGSDGINVSPELAIDFTIATTEGTRRIIRSAFDYAKANGKHKVTAVTKANIIKTTDGKFLDIFYEIASEYPEITADDWYIDIMTAKLLDKNRRKEFSVLVLPNLYGDIITDEAAELQGGVGTAGSANIGARYAMFEAIHGSAPRMIEENREMYADPSSMIKAAAMLLNHIGYVEGAKSIETALEKIDIKITGRDDGVTNEEFTSQLIEMLDV
ncbi:MAG: isocitrate/isopropylmalate dehydrogenase family protein [Lachnospiraceae bacterium]|nr:isocitrate/isopropylmalate dehydrogenase family protein [Lachnospiraceae bacterium]